MVWMSGAAMYTMLALVAATMAIIYLLPKLTKTVPASLVAIVAVTLATIGLGLDTPSIVDYLRTMSGDPTASLKGGLPTFGIPEVPLNLETLKIILPFAIILASVGLIESLLTLTLVDELTQTRGRGNKECLAQGVANVTCGFFGGMGGCAMIGQSMINISSGGRGRTSGVTAALVLLSFVLVASPLIEVVPVAALVGVMFMVVLGTFEWSSLPRPRQGAQVRRDRHRLGLGRHRGDRPRPRGPGRCHRLGSGLRLEARQGHPRPHPHRAQRHQGLFPYAARCSSARPRTSSTSSTRRTTPRTSSSSSNTPAYPTIRRSRRSTTWPSAT